MDDVIYIGQTADINLLIQKINWNRNSALMILECFGNRWFDKNERETAVRFEKLDSEEDFNTFQTGRIFDSEKELFWSPIDKDRFHVIYSGIKAELSELQVDTTVLDRSEQKYMLWGRSLDTPHVFLELKIPRLLRYPFLCEKDKTRLTLKVIEYRDKVTCQIQHYRFSELKEA